MPDHEMKTDNEVSDWWSTDIIEMAPGVIRFRGQPIQDLIGKFSFAQMIWYMVLGDELRELEQRHVSAQTPPAPLSATRRRAAW